ncbi:C2H2 type zinc finger containing protein [Coccidioides posadasii C735 delta SOWgp]|uniref:C2H2 type zinc finger containing protein n=1 Tax=Coccidioides posadasii (strain C735) TaxID=222929 RepID=C5P8N7_COCP7|nr:C2H2 type zinc finger containing protein [Coccidioides posadasii C735 delta SOWgp]EER26099.1 C2H2 type zinc finger containing protein [Coccidioides posadasii C735 delta SOWgp]|eukprot:XP_003068244.1 C2H2 type zinc finger containing protein [Coccidioides posadasii C735 delta SOWgp]
MDNRSLASPPSIRVCHSTPTTATNTEQNHRLPSRSPSYSKNSDRSPSSYGRPMAIPNSNEPLAPPPLPPPRFIEDLAQGHDSGWKWGNSFEGKPTLAPIKPTSSLFGGHSRPPLVRRDETFSFPDEFKCGAAMSAATSPSSETSPSGQLTSPDAARSGSLGSNPSGSRLEGEKPLSKKCVERSSNAYDQHLLSKIGKPGSPPRLASSLGTSLNSTSLPFHSKTRTLSTLSIGDGSLSPRDIPPRWGSGPPSAAISPGTKMGAWQDYVGYHSPTGDSSVHSPMEIDSFNHARERYNSNSSGRRPTEERPSISERSSKASYDQGMFAEQDTDFAMDDAGPTSQPSLPGRMSFTEGFSSISRNSMKRRASSPPRGAAADPMYGFTDVDRDRRALGLRSNSCTSPTTRYPGSHGSISSISSSLRTESYASSTGLSAAASSISSFGGPSPGGISPTSDLDTCYERSYLPPTSHRSQYAESVDMKSSVSRKGSTQNGIGLSKPTAPRIGRLYICECCPKKPKKLESLEELRAHEMEKQYTCQFCNKRFKNKNEAERHQNSLHLRRHSWSCAALSNPESAFHPSASPTCQTPNGPSHDTCGYCGVEFTNFPKPEWDRRMEHLINIHKFGECNQAKKFYRADHFPSTLET